MKFNTKCFIYTVISALLFGVTPVLGKYTYELGSNSITLTFYRNILVFPVLLIVMIIMKIPFRISRKELGAIVLVGAVFRAGTTLMHYTSFSYIDVGLATTLHFLFPVFTALISFLFFKTKLGLFKGIALAVATAGVVMSSSSLQSGEWTGIFLAVTSGLTYAIYLIGMEKTCLSTMHPIKVACYMRLSNGLVMMLFITVMSAFGNTMFEINYILPPKAFIITFIVAILTSFIAVALLQMGIRGLGATTASILSMLEPASCVIVGWIFLSEEMTWSKILSCILIFSAVLLIIWSDQRKNKISDT